MGISPIVFDFYLLRLNMPFLRMSYDISLSMRRTLLWLVFFLLDNSFSNRRKKDIPVALSMSSEGLIYMFFAFIFVTIFPLSDSRLKEPRRKRSECDY